jgi:hypothetical protein
MPRVQRASLLTAAIAGTLAVGLTATAARADWLVLRDGARIETKGTWKVDGRKVLFTMPNGTLSVLRTDDVDLDQSALATTQAREAPPMPAVPVKEKKEPVLRLTEKDIPPVGSLSDDASGKDGEGKEGADKKEEASALEVISWEKTENATGDGLEIFGTIKNGSPNIITTPTLLVAIYDADGGLLATNGGDINSPQIQPGKTANFRVAFPGVPDFASVKFDAQGRGFKPRVENAQVDESEAEEYEEPAEAPVDEGTSGDADEPPPL